MQTPDFFCPTIAIVIANLFTAFLLFLLDCAPFLCLTILCC